MLCMSSGRERFIDEYTELLSSGGWTVESKRPLTRSPFAIPRAVQVEIEARCTGLPGPKQVAAPT
jgi:hypothetical protein